MECNPDRNEWSNSLLSPVDALAKFSRGNLSKAPTRVSQQHLLQFAGELARRERLSLPISPPPHSAIALGLRRCVDAWFGMRTDVSASVCTTAPATAGANLPRALPTQCLSVLNTHCLSESTLAAYVRRKRLRDVGPDRRAHRIAVIVQEEMVSWKHLERD